MLDKKKVFQLVNAKTTKDPVTGCWLYNGQQNNLGYGIIKIQGDNYKVHRLSLYIHKDFDLNSPLQALHSIECKNRHCWNPNPLRPGTQAENNRDAAYGGTNNNSAKTHCKRGHAFNTENTAYSNDLIKRRICKTCKREAARERLGIKPGNFRVA